MKQIERLVQESATEAGKWEPTHYTSLRQARQLNPGEYANSFRVANPRPAMRSLADAETATVLCALRNLQDKPEWGEVEPADHLSSDQIDALCDRISTIGGVGIASDGSPRVLDAATKGRQEWKEPNPIDRQYDGQAHHMAKAANSLVNLLNELDYSKVETEAASSLTNEIHNLINHLESADGDLKEFRAALKDAEDIIDQMHNRIYNK